MMTLVCQGCDKVSYTRLREFQKFTPSQIQGLDVQSKLPAKLVSSKPLPWPEHLLELSVEAASLGGEVLTGGAPSRCSP